MAQAETNACCPPTATPYLAADEMYKQKGSVVEAGVGGVPCYATGNQSAKTCVIVVGDVWGYNGGRLRALADNFARAGDYGVLVPKLLQPALEGGTDGDGLPPDFVISEREADFFPWIKSIRWEDGDNAVKPKLDQVIAFAKANGAEKFGIVGFCWGGWVAFKASAVWGEIACGAIAHPSAHIEEKAHGGNNEAMSRAVQAPMLLLNAKDDPEDYDEGGDIFRHLKAGSQTARFPDMSHGWTTRGDVQKDAIVGRDVALAVERMSQYLRQFLGGTPRPATPPVFEPSPESAAAASADARLFQSVASLSVGSAREAEGGHHIYPVSLTLDDGSTQTLWRRFKQFEALHSALGRSGIGGCPALPQKRIFGNKSPDFVKKRAAALDNYLRAALSTAKATTQTGPSDAAVLFGEWLQADMHTAPPKPAPRAVSGKAPDFQNNIILLTDSYKLSHFRQYPPGTEVVYSYFESRGGKWDEVVFFGLQYFLMRYLEGEVVTTAKIEQAAEMAAQHMGDEGGQLFNREGWEYIVREHGGRLPISIKAVPEGMVVPTRNVLFTMENTDPKCFWLTNYLETLLVQVWYPMTVAQNSRFQKKIISDWLGRTGTANGNDDGLLFKLHDFGYRGVSSVESAALGGAAHLVNFMGTDTMAGYIMARQCYDEPMAGVSIPAAEHSTMTSWTRDREADAYRNMLTQFPTGLVAVVSDSYDIINACENIWGKELKEMVENREGTLVVRPDSGDPPVIVVQVLNALGGAFADGITRTATGHKLLPRFLRVIQGDGIDAAMLESVLAAMADAGWAADNLAFGSGGALLQKLNRDTQKCAFKCSHAQVAGEAVDVFKDPVTDKGKKSKKGRLTLEYEQSEAGPRLVTITEGRGSAERDQLVEVFNNGRITKRWTFKDVRERAAVKETKFKTSEALAFIDRLKTGIAVKKRPLGKDKTAKKPSSSRSQARVLYCDPKCSLLQLAKSVGQDTDKSVPVGEAQLVVDHGDDGTWLNVRNAAEAIFHIQFESEAARDEIVAGLNLLKEQAGFEPPHVPPRA